MLRNTKKPYNSKFKPFTGTFDDVEMDSRTTDTIIPMKPMEETVIATTPYERACLATAEKLYKLIDEDVVAEEIPFKDQKNEKTKYIKRYYDSLLNQEGGIDAYLNRLYHSGIISIKDFVVALHASKEVTQMINSRMSKLKYLFWRNITAIANLELWNEKGRFGFFCCPKTPDGIDAIRTAESYREIIIEIVPKIGTFSQAAYEITGIRRKITNEFYELIAAIGLKEYMQEAVMRSAILVFCDKWNIESDMLDFDLPPALANRLK